MRRSSAELDDLDPIEIVDYDPGWSQAFALEATRVIGALGAQVMAIEHIGSTAVEELAAKPIIDIQVGVRSLDATPMFVSELAEIGYSYHPEFEEQFPLRRFFRKMVNGRRTHQIHLVERSNTEWWDRHVVFRDWLRAHQADRQEYQDLKRELVKRYSDDRDAYTEAKSDFVNRVTRMALSTR